MAADTCSRVRKSHLGNARGCYGAAKRTTKASASSGTGRSLHVPRPPPLPLARALRLAMLLSVPNILLDLGAIGLVLATMAFALQAASTIFLRDRPFPTSPYRPSIAVLMPAHNEEQNIEATLTRIKQRDLLPGDRLVVVADNCVDQTAMLAMRAGAEVIVRNDLTRRGKGFALAAGLDHLAARESGCCRIRRRRLRIQPSRPGTAGAGLRHRRRSRAVLIVSNGRESE